MFKKLNNIGDCGIVCDFGDEVNQTVNTRVIKLFHHIKREVSNGNLEGILNYTPSYNKLIISFDLSITNYLKLKKQIENLEVLNYKKNISTVIKIPVCCEENFALDFGNLSKELNFSKEIILDIFFKKEYFCYMTGFIAGMPFLGNVDKKIRMERLKTPRVRVPQGSVGITDQFTNIYTMESPGGWNIIGNTPKKVFNKSDLKNPALIKPGDKVIFYQISKEEYNNWNE